MLLLCVCLTLGDPALWGPLAWPVGLTGWLDRLAWPVGWARHCHCRDHLVDWSPALLLQVHRMIHILIHIHQDPKVLDIRIGKCLTGPWWFYWKLWQSTLKLYMRKSRNRTSSGTRWNFHQLMVSSMEFPPANRKSQCTSHKKSNLIFWCKKNVAKSTLRPCASLSQKSCSALTHFLIELRDVKWNFCDAFLYWMQFQNLNLDWKVLVRVVIETFCDQGSSYIYARAKLLLPVAHVGISINSWYHR